MARKKTRKKNKFDIKKIDFTQAATRAGGLGVGGVAAGALNNVLVRQLPPNLADKAFVISNGITAVAGVLASEGAVGEGDFVKAVGDGMTAIASVNLVSSAIPDDMKIKLGINGPSQVSSPYRMPIREASLLRGIQGAHHNEYDAGEVFNNVVLAGLENAHSPIIGNIIS